MVEPAPCQTVQGSHANRMMIGLLVTAHCLRYVRVVGPKGGKQYRRRDIATGVASHEIIAARRQVTPLTDREADSEVA
jgi:hypothetical protein